MSFTLKRMSSVRISAETERQGVLPSFGYVLIGHWPGGRSSGPRLRLESWRSGEGKETLVMSSSDKRLKNRRDLQIGYQCLVPQRLRLTVLRRSRAMIGIEGVDNHPSV